MNEPVQCPKCFSNLGVYRPDGTLHIKHGSRQADLLVGVMRLSCGRWLEERQRHCDGQTLVRVEGNARATVVA